MDDFGVLGVQVAYRLKRDTTLLELRMFAEERGDWFASICLTDAQN